MLLLYTDVYKIIYNKKSSVLATNRTLVSKFYNIFFHKVSNM